MTKIERQIIIDQIVSTYTLWERQDPREEDHLNLFDRYCEITILAEDLGIKKSEWEDIIKARH